MADKSVNTMNDGNPEALNGQWFIDVKKGTRGIVNGYLGDGLYLCGIVNEDDGVTLFNEIVSIVDMQKDWRFYKYIDIWQEAVKGFKVLWAAHRDQFNESAGQVIPKPASWMGS